VTDRRVLGTFLGALAVTLTASGVYLAAAGPSEEGLRLLLRLTAQIAFVLLLFVFVARPLRELLRTSLTLGLLRNRALLGVAFAGVHTAHLALLVLRVELFPDFDLLVSRNVPGALSYLVMYAMLLTTFRAPKRALGPRAWRVLHKLGLFWLTYAFSQTQLPHPTDDLSGMNWWLVSLLGAALVIRLTAFFAKLGGVLKDCRDR
jgi:DMSO/TMAO reductase YedYZ heme-binding membrane subunit